MSSLNSDKSLRVEDFVNLSDDELIDKMGGSVNFIDPRLIYWIAGFVVILLVFTMFVTSFVEGRVYDVILSECAVERGVDRDLLVVRNNGLFVEPSCGLR